MLPEITAARPQDAPTTSSSTTTEPQSSSLRRHTLDAVPIFSDQSSAVSNAPPHHQKRCAACHYSCLKCRRANDYDCSACAPDAQLTERSANETYCLPIADKVQPHSVPLYNTDKGNNDDNRLRLFLVILVGILAVITVVLLAIFVRSYTTWWGGGGERPSYAYDKLSMSAQGDDAGDDYPRLDQLKAVRHGADDGDAEDSDDVDGGAVGGVERR